MPWGYKLTEKDCFTDLSCYQFRRKEIFQKAKENNSKEKAAEYYLENREAIKKKSRDHYKNLSEEEEDRVSKTKISASDSVQKRSITK